MNGAASRSSAENQVSPLLLTPTEAARALSIGRTTLYSLMGRGDLPFVYAGGVRRIPVVALHKYVEAQMRRQGFQP